MDRFEDFSLPFFLLPTQRRQMRFISLPSGSSTSPQMPYKHVPDMDHSLHEYNMNTDEAMQTTLHIQLLRSISYTSKYYTRYQYASVRETRHVCVMLRNSPSQRKTEGKREKQYAYYASLCKAPAFFLLDWTAVLYRSFACRGEAVFAPGEVWREVISSRVAPTTPDGLV